MHSICIIEKSSVFYYCYFLKRLFETTKNCLRVQALQMDLPTMIEPQVTIVVVPRERFSLTCESLESIYEHTKIPFNLVYVDGSSPTKIRRYLEAKSREKGFQLIRTDYYLSPNHARNLGLAQVKTKYVVFMDNDVVVAPYWLKNLVQCAEETGAAVVSPLVCQGQSLHAEVHCAGGESAVLLENKDGRVRRRLHEKIYQQGRKVDKLRDSLARQETGLAEFHCMIVRSQIFESIGSFDEALMNTREHVDFCIAVAEAGGTVYFEPSSVVTYVTGLPLQLTDIPFYMLRWSDAWGLTSLDRLREKWNLTEDDYYKHSYNAWREYLVGRRKIFIIRPMLAKYVFGRTGGRLEKTLVRMEKALNRYLTTRYAQKHPEIIPQQLSVPVQKSPATVG